ncbi:MAG: DUF2849 domain-containing protein [Asticcacaulis sp.]
MKLLTANQLRDGLTLWWGAEDWVLDAAQARPLDDAEAEALQAEWALRETEVVGPYLIPLTDANAPVQREHVREFVRANGPTVGPTTYDIAHGFHRAEIFQG